MFNWDARRTRAAPCKAGSENIAAAENMNNNSPTLIYDTGSGARKRTLVEKALLDAVDLIYSWKLMYEEKIRTTPPFVLKHPFSAPND